MDVQQIREAFLLSSRIEEKIRGFRDQRLSLIESGEAPTSFPPGPKLVLHSIPFQSVAPGGSTLFELDQLKQVSTSLEQALDTGRGFRPNLDGLLAEGRYPRKTVQMFRSGALEFVSGEIAEQREDLPLGEEFWLLPGISFGARVVKVTGLFLTAHEALGLDPPVLLLISLLGTRGCAFAGSARIKSFDREVGPLPDVYVQDFGDDAPPLVRPVLDIVWQAAGYERCSLFDQQGNWKG